MADDEITRADARGPEAPKQDVETVEMTQPRADDKTTTTTPIAAASMDPAHRARVERSLVRKLDGRCSLFVLIYIVSSSYPVALTQLGARSP